MRVLLGIGFFVVACGAGYLVYRAIRARWGRWGLGRFLALWIAWSLASVGLWGGQMLSAEHGIVELSDRFSRYPDYVRMTWPAVLVLGPASALLVAGLFFLRDQADRRRAAREAAEAEAAEWPPEHVAEILAAERQSTRQQCAHLARQLRHEAKRSHRGLPPELKAFVHRYLDSSA